MTSDWNEVRLGDICDIYDGPHATPPKLDSGLIFLGISSLGFDGRIDPSYFEFVSEESFRKWTRRIEPRYQDIVFSYETKLGTAAMIPENLKCCLGRRMGLLRPKKGINPRFLLYAYLAPEFQKTIYERTYHGSTVDRIPLKELPDFPISIPNLETQQAITAVLASLDNKIDLLHRENKTLEALAQTLFRHHFIDNAKPNWQELTLGDHLSCVTGYSYRSADLSPSDTALVTLKNFARDGSFRMDGFKEYTGNYKPSQIVKSGDLVVSHTDITQDADIIGNPALIVDTGRYKKLVITMDLMKVIPTTNWLSKEFLY